MTRLGSQPGLDRRATITKFNKDTGIVTLTLDEAGTQSKITVEANFPGQFDASGSFFGLYLPIGTSVLTRQIHGGQWVITSVLPPDSFFSSILSSSYLDDFLPGRILAQSQNKIRWYLDPTEGFNVGNSSSYLRADTNLDILSHNFGSSWIFTQAGRNIEGVIKRDLGNHASKNFLDTPLESHELEHNLVTIGMDPLAKISLANDGLAVRNPPYVESRKLIYEFANDFLVQDDASEIESYQGTNKNILQNNRHEYRSNVLSLSLTYPNHLIENILGTCIDTFGNVLDINRISLNLGQGELSLRESSDKKQSYLDIKSKLRKSIAYHFELNTKKDNLPNLNNLSDFGRGLSNFFIDLDKEGTLKINIPASSETGNIPLLTRYKNYSELLYSQNNSENPNLFVKSETGQDIFVTSFATQPSITLKDDKNLKGEFSPQDFITGKIIKYGTVYHDITKTGNEFLKTANYLAGGLKLINFHPNNRLNKIITPLDYIVSSEIIISGKEANAGGRSLDLNLDGFINLNIGANTIDRQSMWLDCAGAIISNIGRDKNNISWMGSFDGDVLIQIGGTGLLAESDSRFSNISDAFRNGVFELRIPTTSGIYIIRVAQEGISLISPGEINISAQQNVNIRSNANVTIQGETVMLYPESSKRIINRMPPGTIG